jgi:O-succinylbenzoate synthase
VKIQTLIIQNYSLSLKSGSNRSGIFIQITDYLGKESWGEVAPLPKWSHETLEEAVEQINQKQIEFMAIDWQLKNLFAQLTALKLLPSVLFGLEAGLLSLLSPLNTYQVPMSALLMGTPEEIIKQASLRYREGYRTAKLKVSHLTFEEAAAMIHQLKGLFRLRIDVNRAWNTDEAQRFFAQFHENDFDYVEEPFQNPHELARFTHPLAIDESFPADLSLKELENFPTLKALVYKPTIQGGMTNCLPLHDWARKKGIELVLSSSFESDVGLEAIASMAFRLSLSSPLGLGTYHYLNEFFHPSFKSRVFCS